MVTQMLAGDRLGRGADVRGDQLIVPVQMWAGMDSVAVQIRRGMDSVAVLMWAGDKLFRIAKVAHPVRC